MRCDCVCTCDSVWTSKYMWLSVRMIVCELCVCESVCVCVCLYLSYSLCVWCFVCIYVIYVNEGNAIACHGNFELNTGYILVVHSPHLTLAAVVVGVALFAGIELENVFISSAPNDSGIGSKCCHKIAEAFRRKTSCHMRVCMRVRVCMCVWVCAVPVSTAIVVRVFVIFRLAVRNANAMP